MEKKVVLITGTNSGFGWLAAKSCASSGHKVFATMRDTKGRNADKAKALVQQENIEVLDVDITNGRSVTDAVAAIIKKEGKIDVQMPYDVSKFAVEGLTEGIHYELRSLGEIANEHVKEQYENFLTAFGMKALLD